MHRRIYMPIADGNLKFQLQFRSRSLPLTRFIEAHRQITMVQMTQLFLCESFNSVFRDTDDQLTDRKLSGITLKGAKALVNLSPPHVNVLYGHTTR